MSRKFIEVTNSNNRKIFVNIDTIMLVLEDDISTKIIVVDGSEGRVMESYDEVKALIREAERK